MFSMMFFEAKPIPVDSPPVMANSHDTLMWNMARDIKAHEPQIIIWMMFFDMTVRLSAESGSLVTKCSLSSLSNVLLSHENKNHRQMTMVSLMMLSWKLSWSTKWYLKAFQQRSERLNTLAAHQMLSMTESTLSEGSTT